MLGKVLLDVKQFSEIKALDEGAFRQAVAHNRRAQLFREKFGSECSFRPDATKRIFVCPRISFGFQVETDLGGIVPAFHRIGLVFARTIPVVIFVEPNKVEQLLEPRHDVQLRFITLKEGKAHWRKLWIVLLGWTSEQLVAPVGLLDFICGKFLD